MRLLPYAQLLRIPNVFTAFADILLGTLAAKTLLARPLDSILLMFASGCLYCGGMVWNDYFDFAEDKRDRPFRPLPSGKISRRTAFMLGVALLFCGVAFAALAGRSLPPVLIAVGLVVAILLYDGALKATWIGPVSMASCRFLNVLLGLSLVDLSAVPWNVRIHLASVVGLYIVGVTLFARKEAGGSDPLELRGAAGVMLLALLLALAVPIHRAEGTVTSAYPYLLTAFGFLIGVPAIRAMNRPEPKNVQAAIKRCILGLVVLDAIVATAFVGLYGLLILLLLPPALIIGKRVYST
jgi:4-hydroxybenzoate polyprenyltransferase